MNSPLWLLPLVGLLIVLLYRPPRELEIRDLPMLFNDEPIGAVELRPDFAALVRADESYRFYTLRLVVIYSTQRNEGAVTELFEIKYGVSPLTLLELDDGMPSRFGLPRKEPKTFFLPREMRDIEAFAHHVRVCVDRCRAS